MRTCRCFLFLIVLIAGIICPHICTGQPRQHQSMFVLLIPGLTLQDLSLWPNLDRLCQTSAVGLMNSAGGNRVLPSSYLSISSGTKAVYPEKSGVLGLQKHEDLNGVTAVETYEHYLGTTSNEAQIVIPYFNIIKNANISQSRPGLLADTLSEYDVPLLFIGNQDLPGAVSRPGVLTAMDSKGRIQEGFVDRRTYVVSSFSPTHYTVNYSFLYETAASFLQGRTGIIILDLGDLARLDNLNENLPAAVYTDSRKKLLEEIDSFLGYLIGLVDQKEAALLVLAPYPDIDNLLQGNMLTPVLFYNHGSVESLLSSTSTKRPGIITNLDIAPTILNFFGCRQTRGFVGSPIKTDVYPGARTYLEIIQNKILANYLQRPFLLKSYVILQIALVLSMLFLIFLRHRLLYWIYPFVLALPAGPLFFLVLPLVPSTSLIARTIVLLAAGSLVIFIFNRRTGALRSLTVLYLLTAAFIAGDLLLGSPLMKSSLLGYDPIAGARYYGLGNEYMGVLLGSGLIGITLLIEILKNHVHRHTTLYSFGFIAVLAGLVVLAASPRWGTNVGGGLAFLGSFIILGLLVYRVRLNCQTLALLGIGSLVFLSLLFYFDLQRPVDVQSHIGLTARLIREEGLASLLPIFSRKVLMNIKLIHYSLWTRVFLTFLAATAFIFSRPPGLMKKIFAEYPYLRAGSIAGICGSFIALVVNDSGIVAAATAMIFVAPTLLYLVTARLLELEE